LIPHTHIYIYILISLYSGIFLLIFWEVGDEDCMYAAFC
jgi:hypothetical protein